MVIAYAFHRKETAGIVYIQVQCSAVRFELLRKLALLRELEM